MRAVLFEGTPEEFARVEAAFRAGGDPTLQTRSIVLPQTRPKAWPDLDEEQCHRLAKQVLERAPARLVDALRALAEAQNFSGDQTTDAWADYADRQPDELCGMLAELARSASRGFIELFGCDNAPQRVKGAADMLVQKVPSEEGAYFIIRPGLMRAMAELDLLDPLPSEQGTDAETAGAEPRPAAGAPRGLPAPPTAGTRPPPGRPRASAMLKPLSPPEAPRPGTPLPPAPPGGILGEVARLLGSCTEGSAKAPERRGHGMRVMFEVTVKDAHHAPKQA